MASCVCVRPILMIRAHSIALSLSAFRSIWSAGISRWWISSAAAMCMAVG